MAHTTLADEPTFPDLDPGLTLLETDGQAAGALQSLALDHVLLGDAEAVWVDAENNAATTSLSKVAPSPRVLDRIRVARAFTAFQHYSLLEDVEGPMTPATGLLVAPAVDWFYGADDLRAGEGETMLAGALDRLETVAARRDVPVLVSKTGRAGLGGAVAGRCDRTLECVHTRFGPRFTGEAFETLVYERPGGVQTTLAFWRRVLERRHAAALSAAPEAETAAAVEPREVARVGPH